MANTENTTMNYRQWTALICLSLLFLNLTISVWDLNHKPNQPQQGINIFTGGQQNIYHTWSTLEDEKNLYREENCNLSWMDSRIMEKVKASFGAYAALLELIVLRCFGLLLYFPMLMVVGLYSSSEGRLFAREKRDTFQNISATRYKIGIFLMGSVIAGIILFITLPVGIDVPLIGKIPLTIGPFWLTSPFSWTLFLSTLFGISIFEIFSNLSTDV